MTKTLVDIDDELLDVVAAYLGTTTKKDTVNGALAEIVRLRRMETHLQRLEEGALGDWLDPAVRKAAWRQ
jgi:Arc/MetJ family transcription regulator